MILSGDEIKKEVGRGNIHINPYVEELVSVNSVDVRLGRLMFRPKDTWFRDIYAANDDDWEVVEPIPGTSIAKALPGWGKGIKDLEKHSGFILNGGSFQIGTTLEEIGTKYTPGLGNALVPKMFSKSTTGRQALTTAVCAGLGDIGYYKRWAMEVRVAPGPMIPVLVGTLIGQIVFEQATPNSEVLYKLILFILIRAHLYSYVYYQ